MSFKGQPPIQNKLLQKHWEERDLLGHHDRLANMKPRMNTHNPSYTQNKKAMNAKKQLTQELNLRRIQRDNDTLVRRINDIMSKDGVLTHNTAHRAAPTLNEPHRRREAIHIIQENQKILERITETKGMMTRENWRDHARKHDEVINRLRGGTIRPIPNITLREQPARLPPLTREGSPNRTSRREERSSSPKRLTHVSRSPPHTQRGATQGSPEAGSRRSRKTQEQSEEEAVLPPVHVEDPAWYRCEKEFDGCTVRLCVVPELGLDGGDTENGEEGEITTLKLLAASGEDEVAEIVIPIEIISNVWVDEVENAEESDATSSTSLSAEDAGTHPPSTSSSLSDAAFISFMLSRRRYMCAQLMECLQIAEGALIFIRPAVTRAQVIVAADEWEERDREENGDVQTAGARGSDATNAEYDTSGSMPSTRTHTPGHASAQATTSVEPSPRRSGSPKGKRFTHTLREKKEKERQRSPSRGSSSRGLGRGTSTHGSVSAALRQVEGSHLSLSIALQTSQPKLKSNNGILLVLWGKREHGTYVGVGHSCVGDIGASVDVAVDLSACGVTVRNGHLTVLENSDMAKTTAIDESSEATAALTADDKASSDANDESANGLVDDLVLKCSIYAVRDMNKVEDDDILGSIKVNVQALLESYLHYHKRQHAGDGHHTSQKALKTAYLGAKKKKDTGYPVLAPLAIKGTDATPDSIVSIAIARNDVATGTVASSSSSAPASHSTPVQSRLPGRSTATGSAPRVGAKRRAASSSTTTVATPASSSTSSQETPSQQPASAPVKSTAEKSRKSSATHTPTPPKTAPAPQTYVHKPKTAAASAAPVSGTPASAPAFSSSVSTSAPASESADDSDNLVSAAPAATTMAAMDAVVVEAPADADAPIEYRESAGSAAHEVTPEAASEVALVEVPVVSDAVAVDQGMSQSASDGALAKAYNNIPQFIKKDVADTYMSPEEAGMMDARPSSAAVAPVSAIETAIGSDINRQDVETTLSEHPNEGRRSAVSDDLLLGMEQPLPMSRSEDPSDSYVHNTSSDPPPFTGGDVIAPVYESMDGDAV